MLRPRLRGWCVGFASFAAVVVGTLVASPAALAWQAKGSAADAVAVPPNPLRDRGATQRLPWERGKQPSSLPKLHSVTGPREFLARYGVSDSQWEGLIDGQELQPSEAELVIRLLSLYSRLGQDNVEIWAIDDLTWDQLAAAAAEQRGQLFRATGRVKQATEVKLPEETAARYDFDRYYRVHMQIADAPYAAILFCRELPTVWKPGAVIDEQASAFGLFLKIGDAQAEPTPLLLATHRLAWHPAEPRPAMNVHRAHVALADLGVDIGRFQEVGKERAIGLLAADREPFYQILAALGSGKADDLPLQQETLEVVALLQEPGTHQGKKLPVRGLARRVARVEVPDPDIRRRFGIDHYFEVDLSIPIDQTIRMGADPKNKESAVIYENRFPATICVRELPAGLVVGDELRQSIESQAVFFKIWLYHSTYARQAKLPQPAPLFLARTVRVVPVEEASTFWSDLVVGTAMALAAAVFVGIFLWFRWSDRDRRQSAEVSPSKPDFSDLR